MLSEISQTEKDKYCTILLIQGPRTVKFMARKQNGGRQGFGGSGGSKKVGAAQGNVG